MKSTLIDVLIVAGVVIVFAGCEISPPDLSSVVTVNDPTDDRGVDQPTDGSTDSPGDSGTHAQPPTPAVATQPAECSAALDVSFNVKIHTLFVNNSLLIDGLFDWRADGLSGQLVDLEFKTNATQWTTIAGDLPSADVKTIDLSYYAGPSSSWHFRAVTWHPACPQNLSYSDITTIQN